MFKRINTTPPDAKCVSVGMFPLTYLGRGWAIQAWHCRHNGTVTWPNGETANVAKLVRIGNSDICLTKLDHSLVGVPAVVIRGVTASRYWWVRNQHSRLIRVALRRNGNLLQWVTNLEDGDSGGPFLAPGNLFCGLATGFDEDEGLWYGPALWAYVRRIRAVKD